MKQRVILDTGPLVALINGSDNHYRWAKLQFAHIRPPLLSCEAVISEACFLLRNHQGGQKAVFEILRRDILHIPFRLSEHVNQVAWLLDKYSDVPMSLADACLVRLTELYAESSVLTLDSDFSIYRKNKKQIIPILSPHNR
jgi:predicted nucleic acid-binding protein